MSDRTPQSPPVIAPVPNDEERPLWSVMIPTYNCINYLGFTLESVLSQDPGPELMQIEVVDDCSTDGDVQALVNSIGKGRVKFFKQQTNKGSLRNFETCLNRSRGKWIHMLHGDDLIKVGFYDEIKRLFEDFPTAGAAFTDYVHIDYRGDLIPWKNGFNDPYGIIDNWLYRIAQQQLLQPPAIVVKRSVYENLGGFFGVHYGEDWEMWIRIAANYPVAYSPACLALYRAGHNTNITYRSLISGQNVKDIAKVIDIIQDYLPVDQRKELRRSARKYSSISYVQASHKIYAHFKNPKAAFAQAYDAFKLYPNAKSLYLFLKLYVRHFINLVHPRQ